MSFCWGQLCLYVGVVQYQLNRFIEEHEYGSRKNGCLCLFSNSFVSFRRKSRIPNFFKISRTYLFWLIWARKLVNSSKTVTFLIFSQRLQYKLSSKIKINETTTFTNLDATSVDISIDLFFDLNLFNAASLLFCDICPCSGIAAAVEHPWN